MSTYLKNTATRVGRPTQKQRLDKKQVENSEGGFVYPVTDEVRLDRFLILGSEGGSYYASEQKLSLENAEAVGRAIEADGPAVVRRVVEISESGRAAKNDPAIFVLAMAAASTDRETRTAALAALPKVCRIGTHLFHFAEYVEKFRGWGRGLRREVANWYLEKNNEDLQNQLVKYQSRDGWSHYDLLRLSHAKPSKEWQRAAFAWTIGKEGTVIRPGLLPLVDAFDEAKKLKDDPKAVAKLVREHQLTREMVPTEALKSKEVWEALFEKMPMTAMIRNLANMTRNGLIAPMSDTSKEVVKRLKDQSVLKKARVHPIQLLIALKTYQVGHGMRSQGEGWKPVSQVVDALDEAFYLAFGNIEPTGKRWYLGLDVSGSMGGGAVAGVEGFTPREAAAAMSMVTARTESEHVIRGFADSATGRRMGKKVRPSMHHGYDVAMIPLEISPRERLDDVVRKTSNIPFGGTDCALPMLDALEDNLKVDVFVVYTDAETWAGDIHPKQALQMYRQRMGIPAKLIVVGMVSNNFTIASPDDAGMLDVVGFDTNAPQLMSQFAMESLGKL